MTLLSRLPIFPLYYNGETIYSIHCSDLTDVIQLVISKNVNTNIIECVGPEVLTFKQILIKLLNLINKKTFITISTLFGYVYCKLFQLLPNPLLTVDQLKLLKYNNTVSGKYKTNFDIGSPAKRFSMKLKYSYMWRGGQFSKEGDNLIKSLIRLILLNQVSHLFRQCLPFYPD